MTKELKLPPAGVPWRFGKLIATGGEGQIREVAGYPDLLAKIFINQSPTELAEKERKLVAMIGMNTLAGHSRLAWPLRRFNIQGKCGGYLMKRVEGISLVPLSAEVARKAYLPNWTPAHTTRAVHDIASLCATLESHGIFLVDVSLTNFLVRSSDGSVSIIDTDSLQVTSGREIFGATVFTPDFAAPEILRHPEHLGCIGSEQARFTIALLFFQLFAQGSPYQVFENRDLDPSQQIQSGRHFLGGRGVATGTTTPALFSRYLGVPRRIAALCKKAFIDGHHTPAARPTFQTWADAAKAHYHELRG